MEKIERDSMKEWIQRLSLKKHPEGGYYRETYRSKEFIPAEALPERYGSKRNCSTAIYYLLPREEFSAFHRIKSDELWHFYAGAPLTLSMISPRGRFSQAALGLDLTKGYFPQMLIPRGTWFAAAVAQEKSGGNQQDFALTGCTVAPGFDFLDFEMACRETLLKKFPACKRQILQWTR